VGIFEDAIIVVVVFFCWVVNAETPEAGRVLVNLCVKATHEVVLEIQSAHAFPSSFIIAGLVDHQRNT
jgi:hypothetical protein